MAIHTINLVHEREAYIRWADETHDSPYEDHFDGEEYEATVFVVHPRVSWADPVHATTRPFFLPQAAPYLHLVFDPADGTRDEERVDGPLFGPAHIEALFLGAIRLDREGVITTLNVVYTPGMEREARTLAGLLGALLPSVESPDIPPDGEDLNRTLMQRAHEWLERNDHTLGAVNVFVEG